MRFCLLASGSKGNCFLLQDENLNLLVDCGSTKRYLTQCFEELHFSLDDLDALLLTHDHSDHISQIKMFQEKVIFSPVEIQSVNTIKVKKEPFQIEHVTVRPLQLSHDALNTTGYVFETWNEKLVYITDTGYVKQAYIPYLKDADYIVLESNHDIEMLMETNRPAFLKSRIASDNGHLCNEDAAYLLTQIVSTKTKGIILAHISEESNTRELALETTVTELRKNCSGKMRNDLWISAAGQYEMIKGGDWNEEMDLGTCTCVIGMEHLAHK